MRRDVSSVNSEDYTVNPLLEVRRDVSSVNSEDYTVNPLLEVRRDVSSVNSEDYTVNPLLESRSPTTQTENEACAEASLATATREDGDHSDFVGTNPLIKEECIPSNTAKLEQQPVQAGKGILRRSSLLEKSVTLSTESDNFVESVEQGALQVPDIPLPYILDEGDLEVDIITDTSFKQNVTDEHSL